MGSEGASRSGTGDRHGVTRFVSWLDEEEARGHGIRGLLRLSAPRPLTRWLVVTDGHASTMGGGGWLQGSLPPGTHVLFPARDRQDPAAVEAAAWSLTGIGAQHVRIDWPSVDGLAARALTVLFSSTDAGPGLAEVSAALQTASSIVGRAVSRATSIPYQEIRRRRALALVLAVRHLEECSLKEACDRVGVSERSMRRFRQRHELASRHERDHVEMISRVLRGHS